MEDERFMEDERKAAAQADGALELLPKALAALAAIEWEGNVEGDYEFQDHTVACPSCSYEVDCETGLPAESDEDDPSEDDDEDDWGSTEVEVSNREGWHLRKNPDGSVVIQGAAGDGDEERKLPTDAEALAFVTRLKEAGSELHRVALAMLHGPRLEERAWQHATDCKLKLVLLEAARLGIRAEVQP